MQTRLTKKQNDFLLNQIDAIRNTHTGLSPFSEEGYKAMWGNLWFDTYCDMHGHFAGDPKPLKDCLDANPEFLNAMLEWRWGDNIDEYPVLFHLAKSKEGRALIGRNLHWLANVTPETMAFVHKGTSFIGLLFLSENINIIGAVKQLITPELFQASRFFISKEFRLQIIEKHPELTTLMLNEETINTIFYQKQPPQKFTRRPRKDIPVDSILMRVLANEDSRQFLAASPLLDKISSQTWDTVLLGRYHGTNARAYANFHDFKRHLYENEVVIKLSKSR